MSFSIVDIGVNLMHRSFSADREMVVRRAQDAGVSVMIMTGTSLRNSQDSAKYTERLPGVLYSTAGVHPHDARHCNTGTLNALQNLAKQHTVVAVGECGLDFDRDFSPRPDQERWFDAQIALACQVKKPLFLHERSAHRRFVDILQSHMGQFNKAVVHCFTGTADELRRYLDMGLYIGITGWICDERRGQQLRGLVKHIPLDRLMIETDAPFLTPRTMNTRPPNGRNEPAFLPYVAKAIAQATGRSAQEIAEATTRTACSFFGLEM